MIRISSLFFALLLASLFTFACASSDDTVDGDLDQSEYAPWEKDQLVDGDADSESQEVLEIWEQGEVAYQSVIDEPYLQWRSQRWHTSEGSNVPVNLKAVTLWHTGGAYLGAANGIFRFDPRLDVGKRLFKLDFPLGVTKMEVLDMTVGENNTIYIIANTNKDSWLYRIRTENFIEEISQCVLTHVPNSIATKGVSNWIYIATSGPVYFFNGSNCSSDATAGKWPEGGSIDMTATASDKAAIIKLDYDADHNERYELQYKDGTWFGFAVEADEDDNISGGLIDGQLTSVEMFEDSDAGITEIWISAKTGIQMRNQRSQFVKYLGLPCASGSNSGNNTDCGLPDDKIINLSITTDGTIWAATENGVLRKERDSDRWQFFNTKRWLLEPANPDDVASTAIGFDLEGDAWIGHLNGVTRLYRQQMTLKQKADYFHDILRKRHIRMDGFAARCSLPGPGDVSACELWLEANESLNTGMYALSETFRARSAKSGIERQAAADNAWASLQMIMELIKATDYSELPEISGLPARTILPRGDGPIDDPEAGKWFRSDHYDWLGDSGMESMLGHILIYPFFFDLLADDAQKVKIKATYARLADHLILNNWKLIDADNEPTSLGHFEDTWVTGEIGQAGNGGVRALQLLALLRSAYHVTGDQKYLDAYLERAGKAKYAEATRNQKTGSVAREKNHKEDHLAFLNYLVLLRYANYTNYRNIYQDSIASAFGFEKPETSPLFNFIYGIYNYDNFDLEKAMQHLRDIPMDLIDWRIDTCKDSRLDVTEDSETSTNGKKQLVSVLPVSERKLSRLDANPYECEWSGNSDDLVGGKMEDDGVFFLLPYWMARYYDIIKDPKD